MIAKLIVRGHSKKKPSEECAGAFGEFIVQGVDTNHFQYEKLLIILSLYPATLTPDLLNQ